MHPTTQQSLAKVPELTLIFWIIKIAATTLGETGGDALSMSMHLGYLISTLIFAAVFLIAVFAQIKAKTFLPLLYWATIIATTTVGTTLADFADRSLGIGYAGGSRYRQAGYSAPPSRVCPFAGLADTSRRHPLARRAGRSTLRLGQ